MYVNVHPHRYNGPRESIKCNISDYEIRYAEISVSTLVNTLSSLVEDTKEETTMSEIDLSSLSYGNYYTFTTIEPSGQS